MSASYIVSVSEMMCEVSSACEWGRCGEDEARV